jgi:hypothetical protein
MTINDAPPPDTEPELQPDPAERDPLAPVPQHDSTETDDDDDETG